MKFVLIALLGRQDKNIYNPKLSDLNQHNYFMFIMLGLFLIECDLLFEQSLSRVLLVREGLVDPPATGVLKVQRVLPELRVQGERKAQQEPKAPGVRKVQLGIEGRGGSGEIQGPQENLELQWFNFRGWIQVILVFISLECFVVIMGPKLMGTIHIMKRVKPQGLTRA